MLVSALVYYHLFVVLHDPCIIDYDLGRRAWWVEVREKTILETKQPILDQMKKAKEAKPPTSPLILQLLIPKGMAQVSLTIELFSHVALLQSSLHGPFRRDKTHLSLLRPWGISSAKVGVPQITSSFFARLCSVFGHTFEIAEHLSAACGGRWNPRVLAAGRGGQQTAVEANRLGAARL